MLIGVRIKELRKQKGLSQTELAEEIGLSLNTISKIEANKSDIPSEALKKASEVFGVSADYLLTGKEGTTEISEEERKVIELYREDGQIRKALKNTIELKEKVLDQLGQIEPKIEKQ